MPIGSSLGGTYADSFDFMLQTSQQNSAQPSDSETGSKPEPVIGSPVKTTENAKAALSTAYDFLVPESLKPEDPAEIQRKLKAFEDAKPGDKVPEMENPALKMLAGATDVAAMGIPVPVKAGAISKSLFLGIGGMKRLLGEDVAENVLKTVESSGEAWFQKGFPMEDVYKKIQQHTRVTFGADDLPRYEISNAAAKFTDQLPRFPVDKEHQYVGGNPKFPFVSEPLKLGEILDHPELFKAHPELKDVSVKSTGFNLGIHGAFGSNAQGEPLISLASGRSDKDTMGTLLHEIQHYIQDQEGFAMGANPKRLIPEGLPPLVERLKKAEEEFDSILKSHGLEPDTIKTIMDDPDAALKYGLIGGWNSTANTFNNVTPGQAKEYIAKLKSLGHDVTTKSLLEAKADIQAIENAAFDKYSKHAGEVEARNVQKRMTYDKDEIRQVPPEVTEDVFRGDQIIRK